MGAKKEGEIYLWQQARQHAELVDEDARADTMNATGSMHLIYVWRWADRVEHATDKEHRWAPSYMATTITLGRREAADRHVTFYEAEE